MSKSTRTEAGFPEVEDSRGATVEFARQVADQAPLDEIVRQGAQRMLQAAIDAEVTEFIEKHRDRTDDDGNRLVVRNGYLPQREITTGPG